MVVRKVGCGARLDRPLRCPKNMFFLMQKCWEQNPDDRYDMKQDYLECRARKKKQVRMTETTELTMKDGEDAVEEYLKRNGKSGNKTITKMDSNTTKIIKELQDFVQSIMIRCYYRMQKKADQKTKITKKIQNFRQLYLYIYIYIYI
ncbi:hypothetical protein LOAG_09621, partial [Loa loa]